MKLRWAGAAALIAALTGPADAQQGTAPRFAAPNLSPEGVRALASNCASCHGPGGHPAPGSEVSRLAGRPAAVLARALAEYKRGERAGTVMPQIARGYGDEEIAALVAYFARQEP